RILKKSSISEKARQYLVNRKIDEEIIDNYKLGYSSKNIENLRIFCKKKGISFEDLQKIGLVYKKGKDFVEILAGRLVIPIISSTGKILGFAGRSVDDSEPKYLNTIGLKKTETLYGINVAKEFIREKRVLILVEGYFDVWALYSLGFKNVCAVMGTSLSNAQIELIKKYSNEAILCFDSDRSGKEAMISLITQLVSNRLQVKVANISNYKDPHELYMNDSSKLKMIIENPDKAIKFLTDLYVNQIDVHKKQEFLEKRIFPFFASIRKKLIRDEYIKEFCFESNLSVNYVQKSLQRFQKFLNSSNNAEIIEEEVLIREYGLETYLLVFGIINFDLMLKNHILLKPEWFENKEIALKLYKYVIESIKKGIVPSEHIIHECGLSRIFPLAVKISLQISDEERTEYFSKLLKNLEKKHLIKNLRDFVRKGDYEKVKEIQERIRKGV
ncbi:MAG: toprim domain-containing protein, partial [bacterium]